MPDDKPEQTEQTPKGFKVPVPKRKEFFANMKKVAKAGEKPSAPASSDEK